MDTKFFLMGKIIGEEGGGGEADLVDLTATSNGVYTHSGHDGYDTVTVNVPNSYVAGDEGKVVSNGALVSQSSTTKNANGTYDTTLNNSVTIAVPEPSGNINITDTNSTNVSAYATAQVVDSDLVAGNIKKDVNILGVTGTYEGSGGGSSNGIIITQTDPTTGAPTAVEIKGIANYGGWSLNGWNSVQSVTIDSSLTLWRPQAFQNCQQLTSINIPSGVDPLPSRCFENCFQLTSITVPSSCSYIDSFCFKDCAALSSVTLNEGLTDISANAFQGTASLTTLTLPSSLTSISNSLLFTGGSGIQTLYFLGTPSSIHSKAFQNASYLTHIYVPWSEGAVSGAPWGATGATIHYNWTPSN